MPAPVKRRRRRTHREPEQQPQQQQYAIIRPKPSPKWTKWFDEKWRPAMAWQYIAVCLFDFILAPVITGWFSWKAGIPYVPWKPISLSESGLYHMAMLTILGVATWSRGQEKIRSMEMGVNPDAPLPGPATIVPITNGLTPPPGFTQDAIVVPPGYPDPAASPPAPTTPVVTTTTEVTQRTDPNARF